MCIRDSVTYLSVAITPRQSADHANVENRWEMFVDGHYVMPMTSLFCGSGNTDCFTAKAKAHEVSSTMQVGLRMGGMRIDTCLLYTSILLPFRLPPVAEPWLP